MLENIINKSSSNTNDFPDDKTLDHAVLKTVLYALTDIKTGKQNFSTSPYQYINLWENYLNSENKLVEKPEDIANEVSNRLKKGVNTGTGHIQNLNRVCRTGAILSGLGVTAYSLIGDIGAVFFLGGFFAGCLGAYLSTNKTLDKIKRFQNIDKDRVSDAILRMQDKVEQTINENKNLLQYNKS